MTSQKASKTLTAMALALLTAGAFTSRAKANNSIEQLTYLMHRDYLLTSFQNPFERERGFTNKFLLGSIKTPESFNCNFEEEIDAELCSNKRSSSKIDVIITSKNKKRLARITIDCKIGTAKGVRGEGYQDSMKKLIGYSVSRFCSTSEKDDRDSINLVFEAPDKTIPGTQLICGEKNYNFNNTPLILCAKKDSNANYTISAKEKPTRQTLLQSTGNCKDNDKGFGPIAFNKRFLNKDNSELISMRLFPEMISEICNNTQFAYLDYSQGYLKEKEGDKQAALRYYTKAIKSYPNYPKAYINRGTIRSELRDHKGAISDFDKLLEIKPKHLNALYRRGVERIKLRNYKEALLDNNQVLEIDSNYAPAYRNRGIIKLQLNDIDGACRDIGKSFDLGDVGAKNLMNKLVLNDFKFCPTLIAKIQGTPKQEIKVISIPVVTCRSRSYGIVNGVKTCL